LLKDVLFNPQLGAGIDFDGQAAVCPFLDRFSPFQNAACTDPAVSYILKRKTYFFLRVLPAPLRL
jgi:hypothetical protein